MLYTPDALNRLTTATGTTGNYAGLNLAWTYDMFGNRTSQTPSGSYSGTVPTAESLFYNAKNQINGLSYDAAGNLIDDGTNQYLYDGEGRVCAVYAYQTPSSMTEYIYDPMGNRIAKGAISTFSCNSVTNGFTFTNLYVTGLDGKQLMETSGWNYVLHANFYLNGQLLATNDNGTNWYYNLNDWVGTKRVVANMDGSADVGYVSLPYGDGQQAIAPWGQDDTEHHFTGKERDTESGNDYFFARYYSSNIGRFLSPDWSKNPQGVPYADFTNPQSLNLYGYMRNNPLSGTDPDGHCSAAEMAICAKMTQDMADGMDSSTAAQEGAQMQTQQQGGTSTSSQPSDVVTGAAADKQRRLVLNQLSGMLPDTSKDDLNKQLGTDCHAHGGNCDFTMDPSLTVGLNTAAGVKNDKEHPHNIAEFGGSTYGPHSRFGLSPSLHHNHGEVHVDHFNGGSILGFVPHVIVDVAIGEAFYGSYKVFSY